MSECFGVGGVAATEMLIVADHGIGLALQAACECFGFVGLRQFEIIRLIHMIHLARGGGSDFPLSHATVIGAQRRSRLLE